ncbi:MAG: YIP1 family protein [Methanolinea sp.]|nr:YIP1 family protein [Methanolinea sp.]
MSESVLDKVRGFLFSPTLSFRKARDEEAKETLTYLITLSVFYAIMSTLLTALNVFVHPFAGLSFIPPGPAVEPLLIVSWIFVILVFTLVMAVIFGLWLHIFVYLVGGRKGIWQTEKSVFYNLTPTFVLGWIPAIGPLVGGIWSVVIGVIGIRELHNIPDTKAALAVILAVVIASVIAVIVLGAMLYAVVTSLSMTA